MVNRWSYIYSGIVRNIDEGGYIDHYQKGNCGHCNGKLVLVQGQKMMDDRYHMHTEWDDFSRILWGY